MTWTRRKFLISSATICAGAVVMERAVAPLLSRASKQRVRLLRSRAALPSSAFERGMRTALGGAAADVATLNMPVRFDIGQWRDLAAFVQSGVVLGMVSESEFVLVNELIRNAGARLLYLSEHAVDDAGYVRHTPMSSAASAGVGPWLSRSSGAWPEALGFALGRLAVQQWNPAAMVSAPVPRHDGAVARSSCVSFVFAV